jgi:hypothetical protein
MFLYTRLPFHPDPSSRLRKGCIAVAVVRRVVTAGIVVDDVKLNGVVTVSRRVIDERTVVVPGKGQDEPRSAPQDWERHVF